jgi:hypothetical protein
MSVTPFEAKHQARQQQLAAEKLRHPSSRRYSGPHKALITAAAMIASLDLPDADVHISQDGAILCFDYTGRHRAAGAVREACQALGMVVDELAAETADGCAAVELRGHDLLDGIYRVVRAVIPIPATWTDVV